MEKYPVIVNCIKCGKNVEHEADMVTTSRMMVEASFSVFMLPDVYCEKCKDSKSKGEKNCKIISI